MNKNKKKERKQTFGRKRKRGEREGEEIERGGEKGEMGREREGRKSEEIQRQD